MAKSRLTFAEITNSPIVMKEFFKSLKHDLERAHALWILNNMDLIEWYLDVKYTILTYLQIGVYYLTIPYQFVKLVVQNMKKSEQIKG